MNYELCKRLKDAGFPLKEMDERELAELQDTPFHVPFYEEDESVYHTPTLSELIEECRDRFSYVIRDHKTLWRSVEKTYKDSQGANQGQGSTPEEAVANLYLALNK